jgi:hypothetical protein
MMVFTIALTHIPTFCQSIINKNRAIYPELKVITEWGNCPYIQNTHPQRASEVLRRWILSQYIECMYFDWDTEILDRLTFDKTDKPWLGSNELGIDEWFVYHKDQQDFFKQDHNYFFCPSNHYEITDGIFHHGYTTNHLALTTGRQPCQK